MSDSDNSSNRTSFSEEKRYFRSVQELVKCRILNGVVDMYDVKLTMKQYQQIDEFMKNHKFLRLFYKKTDIYRSQIVESSDQSDLLFLND